jgi:sulfur relay (sulfurtransferase) DsrC/TusE family protein
MFSARNQIRWFEEEWRRANEREVEEVEKVEKIEEPVLQVLAKVSEPVVAEVDEEAAKVAENHAKHVENLRKYFARTTESTTMAIPVHRQKATR